jgi:hydroxymethylpyrimidine kinase / phosphomethylpyrimidine kinase / thiamine-phosphate diphosphorylase
MINRASNQINKEKTPTVWTVAGSDSCAGAGIQADLKTFNSMDIYGCTLITAITAQNTLGVAMVTHIGDEMFDAQLEMLADEFMPNAIKSGMMATPHQAKSLATFLAKYPNIFYICDPVMISTSGSSLCSTETIQAIQKYLLPRANIITPNLMEAHYLSGDGKDKGHSIYQFAQTILKKYSCQSVLIKGGHNENSHSNRTLAEDIWVNDKGATLHLSLPRIHLGKADIHGTGCTLSAVLTACLAKGESVENALVMAKHYITESIRTSKMATDMSYLLNHKPFDLINKLPSITTNTLPPLPNQAFPAIKGDIGFYPIVDTSVWVHKLADLGVQTIQLRIKEGTVQNIEQEIKLSIEIAKKHGVKLFINDHWKIAIKYQAYGIHLGQEDIEGAELLLIYQAGIRLGISTHDYYELARGLLIQPSYIALGPIFETTSKEMRFEPQGIYKLKQWKNLIGNMPLVAIGGITLDDMPAIYQAGADGVSVISYVTQAEDPEKNTIQALEIQNRDLPIKNLILC